LDSISNFRSGLLIFSPRLAAENYQVKIKAMNEKKKIVIADDHTIFREGLRMLLSSNPEFDVLGEASDGYQAIHYVNKFKPDIILVDLSMPKLTGIEAIIEIKKENPETKILVLTMHNTDEHITAALKAGANGFILKDSSYSELQTAINNILNGKFYVCPSISENLVTGYLEGKRALNQTSSWDTLTKTERRILKRIAEGLTSKEIATQFFISVKTVQKHRSNLMQKLDIHNVSELTAYAYKKGVVV